MSENMYKVVLSGIHLEGQDMKTVKDRMAGLFQTSTPVIEELFSRRKAVIKRNLDIKTANRYAEAIKNAGAACYVEKMTSSPEASQPEDKNKAAATDENHAFKPPPPPPDSETPAETSTGGGLKVVPVQMSYKGEDRFLPKQLKKLSPSPNGLNLNHKAFPNIGYNQIAALAAYAPLPPGAATIQLLIFLKNREQPVVLDAADIDYHGFQGTRPAKTASAFRGFLHFLCRKNSTMILEETTFDFLSGNTLPEFDEEKALKYVTAIGRVIEEGSEDEG